MRLPLSFQKKGVHPTRIFSSNDAAGAVPLRISPPPRRAAQFRRAGRFRPADLRLAGEIADPEHHHDARARRGLRRGCVFAHQRHRAGLRHLLRRRIECAERHRRRLCGKIARGRRQRRAGRKDREKDPLLHHKVKTFETQRRVYDEVTVASTVLLDEQRAAREIVRCVEACLRHKRPVYIEVPHDMVDREIPITALPPASARRIRSAHARRRTSKKRSR